MAIQVAGSKQPQFASDEIKESLKGFGQNQSSVPSSIRPTLGERVEGMDIGVNDEALDIVKAKGARSPGAPWVDPASCSADAQRFEGAPKVHDSMRKREGDGTVPSNDRPVTKRG